MKSVKEVSVHSLKSMKICIELMLHITSTVESRKKSTASINSSNKIDYPLTGSHRFHKHRVAPWCEFVCA